MADVRIDNIKNDISVIDGNALLTPELTAIIARLVEQKIAERERQQRSERLDRHYSNEA